MSQGHRSEQTSMITVTIVLNEQHVKVLLHLFVFVLLGALFKHGIDPSLLPKP